MSSYICDTCTKTLSCNHLSPSPFLAIYTQHCNVQGIRTFFLFVYTCCLSSPSSVKPLQMELPKLSRWPVFSLLSIDFLQSVKLACVFGTCGNEAVIVSHIGEVYALGSNSNGCLGVGDSQSSLQPRKVEALSKKGKHVYVYT